jgi:hypothetical protein
MRILPLSTVVLPIALAGAPALADDGWGGEMDTASTGAPSQLDPADLSRAEQAPELTRSQHAWLAPQRNRLPSNPRGQTDFTAYTLEWGETKLGLATITVGLLPRTHVGTVPALDVLGVPNAHVKVNPIRIGGYDLAVNGNHYQLNRGDFSAYQTGVGVTQSLKIAQPLSLHVGAHYAVLGSDGIPVPSELPTPIQSDDISDTDLAAAQAALGMDDLSFRAEAVSVHVATDIRFNRRDSLILQGRAMTWANIETGFTPPPVLGIDKAMEIADSGKAPIAETYVASAAWQFSWKQVDLRIGAGVSNVPGAWLLQSTDLSYRFGGKTRREETRMNRTWRKNKADTKR